MTAVAESISNGDSSNNPFMFTGREYDGGTGLYYYRARYYSWELGRFISEDPIGLAGGINMYAYVGNSPINFTDPTGESPLLHLIGELLVESAELVCAHETSLDDAECLRTDITDAGKYNLCTYRCGDGPPMTIVVMPKDKQCPLIWYRKGNPFPSSEIESSK